MVFRTNALLIFSRYLALLNLRHNAPQVLDPNSHTVFRKLYEEGKGGGYFKQEAPSIVGEYTVFIPLPSHSFPFFYSCHHSARHSSDIVPFFVVFIVLPSVLFSATLTLRVPPVRSHRTFPIAVLPVQHGDITRR